MAVTTFCYEYYYYDEYRCEFNKSACKWAFLMQYPLPQLKAKIDKLSSAHYTFQFVLL